MYFILFCKYNLVYYYYFHHFLFIKLREKIGGVVNKIE